MTTVNATDKTILLAEDDGAVRTVVTQALKRAGYHVSATDNAATLYDWASAGQGDLVITDVRMPGESGLDLIPRLQDIRPDLKVIVISAQNALTTAVTANKKGALDYIPKPFDLNDLLNAVQRALTVIEPEATPEQDITNTDDVVSAPHKSFVVGKSRAMQEVYRTIARLVHSDLTVLITGESGTGKEVIARALHEYSPRKNEAFVALNMAAIPRELIESELFGHEKGAFTGADQRVIGRFEQAEGGTLFLDEIGDMPYEAQTRLLRVLQEGEFTPVGSRHLVKCDVRIIAATNKDLYELVQKGTFREDLYYRLNVIPLHIPALRNRPEDVPALVAHFCSKDKNPKTFDAKALEALSGYKWPGNIRELENTIRRILALYPEQRITAAVVKKELSHSPYPQPESTDKNTKDKTQSGRGHLRDIIDTHIASYYAAHSSAQPPAGVYERILQEVEQPLITQTLNFTKGNQIQAAKILGLNRNTLRKKITDLGITVSKRTGK